MTIKLSSHVLSFNKKLFLSSGNFLIHSIRHLFHGNRISQGEGIQNRIAEHTTPELQRPPERISRGTDTLNIHN